MAHILSSWLNNEVKLTQTVASAPGAFEQSFQNGFLVGELLHRCGLLDDFEKTFQPAQTLDSAVRNYVLVERALRDQLGMQMSANTVYDIIMARPGTAAQMLYDIKSRMFQRRGLSNGRASASRTDGRAVDVADDNDVDAGDRAARSRLRFTNMEHSFFADRLHAKMRHGDRDRFLALQNRSLPPVGNRDGGKAGPESSALDPAAMLRQALPSFRGISDMGAKRGPHVPSNRKAAVPTKALPRAAETASTATRKPASEFSHMRQEIEQFERHLDPARTQCASTAQLSSQSSSSSLAGDSELTAALPLQETKPTLEMSAVAIPASADSSEAFMARIRTKRLEDGTNRKGREQRRRKLILSQQRAHLDLEQAQYEELLLKKLLHQSRQERRMAEQLTQLRREKTVIAQNRAFRELQYQERRQEDYEKALERERALVSQARADYERQLTAQLEQHHDLLAKKAHRRHLQRLEECTALAGDLVEYALKQVTYTQLSNGASVPPALLRDWRTLLLHRLPLDPLYVLDPALEVAPLDNPAGLPAAQSPTDETSSSRSNAALIEQGGAAAPAATEAARPPPAVQLEQDAARLAAHEQAIAAAVPEVVRRGIAVLDQATLDCYLQNEGQWAPASEPEQHAVALNNALLGMLVQNVLEAEAAAEAARKAGPSVRPAVALRLCIVGKRFSGKRTLAHAISRRYGVTILDMNQIVAEESARVSASTASVGISQNNLAGKRAQLALLQGGAPDDAQLVALAAQAIRQIDETTGAAGFVLVDFPRTRQQAALLERELGGYEEPKVAARGGFKRAGAQAAVGTGGATGSSAGSKRGASQIAPAPAPSEAAAAAAAAAALADAKAKASFDVVFVVDADAETCIKRAAGAYVDTQTGEAYHLGYHPPSADRPGVAERLVREDPLPAEQLQHQLAAFAERQSALVDFYAVFQNLHVISGQGENAEVPAAAAAGILDRIVADQASAVAAASATMASNGTLANPPDGRQAGSSTRLAHATPPPASSGANPGRASNATRPMSRDIANAAIVAPPHNAESADDITSPIAAAAQGLADTTGARAVGSSHPSHTHDDGSGSDRAAVRSGVAHHGQTRPGPRPGTMFGSQVSLAGPPEMAGAAAVDALEVPETVARAVTVDGRRLPGREMTHILADQWTLIEQAFSDSMHFFFRSLRREREASLRYNHNVRDRMRRFLDRPDRRQETAAVFQREFNELDEDLRIDSDAKAELHQRAEELRERLWELCDLARDEAYHERQLIVEDRWVDERFVIVGNLYICAMQAEVDRYCETRQFAIDYYKDAYLGGPEDSPALQIALPRATQPPPELAVIFGSLLVNVDAKVAAGAASLGLGSANPGSGRGGQMPEKSAGAGAVPGASGATSNAAAGRRMTVGSSKKNADLPVTGSVSPSAAGGTVAGGAPGTTAKNPPSAKANPLTAAVSNSAPLASNNNLGGVGSNATVAAVVTVNDYPVLYKEIDAAYEAALTVFHLQELQTRDLQVPASDKARDKRRIAATLPGASVGVDAATAQASDVASVSRTSADAALVQSSADPLAELQRTLDAEERILRWRLDRLRAHAVAHLRELRSRAAELYVQLDEWIGARYQNELESVRELVQTVREAIEAESRLQNELVLDEAHFAVDLSTLECEPDTELPFLPVGPDGDDGVFSLIQLANLARVLSRCAPQGVMPVGSLAAAIQRYAEQVLSPMQLAAPALPRVLVRASPSLLVDICGTFDPLKTGFVSWRRFIVAYAEILPFSSDKLTQLAAALNERRPAAPLSWPEFASLMPAICPSMTPLAHAVLFFALAEPKTLPNSATSRSHGDQAGAPMTFSRRSSLAPADGALPVPSQSLPAPAVPAVAGRRASIVAIPALSDVSDVEESGAAPKVEVATVAGPRATTQPPTLQVFETEAQLTASAATEGLVVQPRSLIMALCCDEDGEAGFSKAWTVAAALAPAGSSDASMVDPFPVTGPARLSLDKLHALLHEDLVVLPPTGRTNGSSQLAPLNDPFPRNILSLLFQAAPAETDSLTFREFQAVLSQAADPAYIVEKAANRAAQRAAALEAAVPTICETPLAGETAQGNVIVEQPSAVAPHEDRIRSYVPDAVFESTVANLQKCPLWRVDMVNLTVLAEISRPATADVPLEV